MTRGVDACRFVELPRIESTSGAITPVQTGDCIPFEIARVYYLYDIVAGAHRGGHAHRALEQVFVAAMGAFRIVVDDGRNRRTFELWQPHVGLYLPNMIWSELDHFASGTVAVVLASLPYDESEYIRDYSEFGASGEGAPR